MGQKNLYFIALIPNEELCEVLNTFKQDFASRFDGQKAFKIYPHLTLKAPFRLSAGNHQKLVNWFSGLQIRQRSFLLQLKDFGVFENKDNPVVYVNPIMTKELQLLQNEIIISFSNLFPGPADPVDLMFKPHITIAYRDLSAEMFSKAWEEYSQKSFSADLEVDACHLLQHDTNKWNVISTHKLASRVSPV